jgi:hypothetical protein
MRFISNSVSRLRVGHSREWLFSLGVHVDRARLGGLCLDWGDLERG